MKTLSKIDDLFLGMFAPAVHQIVHHRDTILLKGKTVQKYQVLNSFFFSTRIVFLE